MLRDYIALTKPRIISLLLLLCGILAFEHTISSSLWVLPLPMASLIMARSTAAQATSGFRRRNSRSASSASAYFFES